MISLRHVGFRSPVELSGRRSNQLEVGEPAEPARILACENRWRSSLIADEPRARSRQPECERAADSHRAFDRQCPPLHLNQALGDRQAETSTSKPARRAGIGLPKLIEDGGLRLRRD